MRVIKKLDELMDGALTERFNDALSRVLGSRDYLAEMLDGLNVVIIV